jgi:hypothetical protein
MLFRSKAILAMCSAGVSPVSFFFCSSGFF